MRSFSFIALLKGERDAENAFPQWLLEAADEVLAAKEMELRNMATLVAVRSILGGELRRREILSEIHRERGNRKLRYP